MNFTKKSIATLLTGFAFFLIACGGSQGTGNDTYLSSVIEKTNAKFKKKLESKQGFGEYTNIDFTLKENKLTYSLQIDKDDISEEELAMTMNLMENSPGWVFMSWKVMANDGEETEIMTNDFFVQLEKKNVEILCAIKGSSGKVLAEIPLKINMKELEALEETKKKNDEEVKAIEAKRDRERKIRDADIEAGTFTDPRDKRTYRTGTILGQTWIADDIVYKDTSIFYCDTSTREEVRCNISGSFYEPPVGKLYTWEESKNACPKGWRLPTIEELSGDYFRKFYRDTFPREYMPEYSKRYKMVTYWSSSTKGNQVAAFQCNPIREGNGYRMTAEPIEVPMDKANSEEEKKLVRCIKVQ